MKVPLAAHRSVTGNEQWLDVWANGKLSRLKPPFLPYCFTREEVAAPHSGHEVVNVKPLSTLREAPWHKYRFDTVFGVSELSKEIKPLSIAEDHVPFVERVLVDEPDFYRRWPNTDELRVMTLDVEQWTEGHWPTDNDPLIAIAWAINDEPPVCHLAERKDDSDILLDFLYAVKTRNPDILVGYNVVDYDLRTLVKRCKLQGIDCRALGREPLGEWNPLPGQMEHVNGRLVYDVFDSVKLDQTLYGIKNLQLKTVGEWLGFRAVREDTRNLGALLGTEKLATYNKNDVELCRRLANVYFPNFVELAEFYGAPLNIVMRATSSFHTHTLQGRIFRKLGIVSDGRNDARYPKFYQTAEDQNPFEAAIVEIYRRGLFRPCFKLDFSSMFPSVMTSLGAGSDNTTLLRTEPLGAFQVEKEDGARIYHIPDRNRNWNVVVRIEGKSEMSRLVGELIKRRLELKAHAKKLSDPRERDRLNARQGALKIILNSIYGVNASRHSRYGSLPVALAIVGVARQLIRFVEEHLGDAKIETDTDGVYTQREVDLDELNAKLDAYVQGTLTMENHLRIEADSYAAAYFKERKTYLLLHDDGRLEKHGGAFKGSALCGVHDKTLDKLAWSLLSGKGDEKEVAKACLKMDHYAPEDFVMRIRLGKGISDYASKNALGPQVARAAKERLGIEPEPGTQIEYIKTIHGYDVPTPDTFKILDTKYYEEMVLGILGKLGIDLSPHKQVTLGEWG